MQEPAGRTPNANAAPPPSFAVELPSKWQGGGNETGTANTQFRRELPEQRILQQFPVNHQNSYRPPLQFRPFSITTDSDSLSSGFPYAQRLRDIGISSEQWLQFSGQVISSAKLTKSEDKAAWTAGIATGAASSPFLLVFGPVVGYYMGKSIHKKTVVKKVKEKLIQDGDLRSVLRRWNECVFRERGVQAMLEPPTETGEVVVDVGPGASQMDIEREAKRLAKRFRIVLVAFDPRMHTPGPSFVRDSPVSPQSQQGGWGPASPASTQGTVLYVPSLENLPQHQQQQNLVTPSIPELPAKNQAMATELPTGQQFAPRPAAFELDGCQVTR